MIIVAGRVAGRFKGSDIRLKSRRVLKFHED
jgi:hypothetical protein